MIMSMKGIMISFDDSVVGLVRQALKMPLVLDSFSRPDDRTLRLSMPRGTGNTDAALIILRRFDDSFLIIETERQRQQLLAREAPGFRNPLWAEKSEILAESITTLRAIDTENGAFMRWVSFAKLRGKRGQIIITDGVILPSKIVSQMFYDWNIALLVTIGK